MRSRGSERLGGSNVCVVVVVIAYDGGGVSVV